MHKKTATFIAFVLLLALALTACAAPAAPSAPAAPAESQAPAAAAPAPAVAAEKTLVIAIGADATLLDPESVMNNESGFIMSAVFDGLTKYDKGTSEPGPGLAESWDVSADGKEYTFHKGIKSLGL